MEVFQSFRLNEPNGDRNNGNVKNWNANQFLDGSLQEDVVKRKAHIFHENSDGYLITTFPPESTTELFYYLLFALPNNDAKVVKTFDEFPEQTLIDYHKAIHTSAISIFKTGREINNDIKKIYAVQHFGPNELDKQMFATSLPQLHMHIHSYSYDDIIGNEDLFRKVNYSDFLGKEYRHLFHEPLFSLLSDIFLHELKAEGINISIHRNASSFCVETSDDAFNSFSSEELRIIQTISRKWQSEWSLLAGCFTDFTYNNRGRLNLIDNESIRENINDYIRNKDYFTEKSIYLLNFLGSKIVDASKTDTWSWFFKGANGALAWDFDFVSNTRKLIIAPRTIVIPKKHWAILPEDATHMVIKNRESWYEDDALNKALLIQKTLMNKL